MLFYFKNHTWSNFTYSIMSALIFLLQGTTSSEESTAGLREVLLFKGTIVQRIIDTLHAITPK